MSLNGNNVIGGSGYRKNQPPYEIDQSLRFNDGDTPYLSRTPSSAGNRKTWTWSGWIKRGSMSSALQILFNQGSNVNNCTVLQISSSDTISFVHVDGGSNTSHVVATPNFRDPAAWYHLVFKIDTTQSTAANRVKIYVNGEEQSYSTTTYPSQDMDTDVNSTDLTVFGQQVASTPYSFDGYLAEVNFIDGQALTPASFGETLASTNQWVPIEYVGSYGTNGFYLPFGGEGFLTYDRESEIAVTSNQDWTNSAGAATSVVLDDLVNGVESSDDAGGGWADSAWAASGSYIRFDFGSAKTYKNAQWRYRNSSGTEGTWKWQGSNNASDWTDIGSSFTLSPDSSGVDGVNRSQEFTSQLGSNTTAYRYYQILGISGNMNTSGRRIAMYFSETVYGLGGDSSGQGNNFTATNLSWSDQVLDSPTNNFATLSPLWLPPSGHRSTLSEGNLKAVTPTSGVGYNGATMGTIGMSSGKWYFEWYIGSSNYPAVGIGKEEFAANYISTNVGNRVWADDGLIYGVTYSDTGVTYTTGDIVGCAVDMDNGKMWFSKNGTFISSGDPAAGTNAQFTDLLSASDMGNSGQVLPLFSDWNWSTSDTVVFNAGQDSSFAGVKTAQGNTDGNGIGDFYYSPPSGYLALCSDNLSDPSIADPTAHFNTVLYTGNGSNPRSITGVGFKPDFHWRKKRNASRSHNLHDVVRGAANFLYSDATAAEVSTDANGTLSSFDSDGFTFNSEAGDENTNNSGDTYVTWNWKAGGSASTNEDGSIDSSVSANTTSGFSIVSFDGNSTSGATVGHGLSQAPELIILKGRNLSGSTASAGWVVYSKPVGNTKYLYLNESDGEATDSGRWNDTTPTASVFTLGDDGVVNTGSSPYIAYCFHGVDGYSKVGSYTGNGNANGPFVYTGFRPAFIMLKGTIATVHWHMFDSARYTYNQTDNGVNGGIAANLTSMNTGEGAGPIDILSNGFKIRNANGNDNNNGTTFIYLAFAESPFKYSNAR